MPRGKVRASKKSHASDTDGAASTSAQPPAQPTSYDSIGAAAAGMGVPVSVLKKAKRQGAPGFRGSRVYPDELVPWLARTNAGGPDGAIGLDPKEAAELRIFLADAVFKEQRNEIQANRFTKNEVFIEAIEDLANEQRSILRQKLENEYPSVVAGLEPAQARVYGKRVVDEVFRLMAGLAERFRRKLQSGRGQAHSKTLRE